MLFAVLANFGLDMFYFIWVMTLRGRLPPSLGGFVSDAVYGYTKKLTRELYQGLDKNQKPVVDEMKKKMLKEKEEAAKREADKAEENKRLQQEKKE